MPAVRVGARVISGARVRVRVRARVGCGARVSVETSSFFRSPNYKADAGWIVIRPMRLSTRLIMI